MPGMDEITRFDVAVVGGGMTGLALACALGSDGVETVVVDRVPADAPPSRNADPRVTAVALGSARFLRSVGAFADMEAAGEPILDIEVRESRSPFAVHYDHADVGDEPMGWIVENAVIRAALIARCRELPSVSLWMPATYTRVATTADGVRLELEDGREIRAGLLVAADGKFSKLRERLGIHAAYKDYGQRGIVATLAHAAPHNGLASEHFFPDGPFAVLPMPGDRSSIVWALERELAEEVAALPADAFVAEVADRVGERLGEIELASPVRTFPLVLATVDRFTARRAALVGDAAHGIHPIAGQGWNLALRDVAALAEIVADRHALGLDPGEPAVLEAYERWRGLDTTTLVGVTDGINRLFANDLTPLRIARNLGFAVVDRLPPAKRLFMRHAMGTIGDLPRRMRAQAG
jgi:2-octaprenyl-6-methoxyphenol hydroxylase